MLKDRLLLPIRLANNLMIEGPWKNRIRSFLLGWRNALPRELMVRRGDTVVQVGMWRVRNIQRLSESVGPTGRVVLIEANPDTVRDVLPQINDAGLKNVTVINKGAWHQPGTLEFQVASHSSDNRIKNDSITMFADTLDDAFTRTIRIECDTLDNLLDALHLTKIDYLEISVNGAEPEVLKGATKTLQKTKRVFVAGYARVRETGEPINRQTQSLLNDAGFHSRITRQSEAAAAKDWKTDGTQNWGLWDGHVFAWHE